MGERKVSCHYIPPDFDPSKAPRRCKPQNGQHQVRFMLPMSVQCESCGEYMFQGTKCNSRKELCYNEFYLGIPVYRIYLHCKSCYAEITIKTDPKNCDYIVEKGATRHFEPWRQQQIEQALDLKKKFAGQCAEVKGTEEKEVDTQRDMDQKREIGKLLQPRVKPQLEKSGSKIVSYVLTAEDEDKVDHFDQMAKIAKERTSVPIETPTNLLFYDS